MSSNMDEIAEAVGQHTIDILLEQYHTRCTSQVFCGIFIVEACCWIMVVAIALI